MLNLHIIFFIFANITIVSSTVMHLHIVYYTFIMTFPLKGATGFIGTIAFGGLHTLIIAKLFVLFLYYIYKYHFGSQSINYALHIL